MTATRSQIAAIGIAVPSLQLPIQTLADHLDVDPNKYTIGLGCIAQSLCNADEHHVDLGIRAAKDALKQWGGKVEDIGMLAVGTECALDMARPLGAWMAADLNLPENVRSYEVKHACYAGTLALKQAVEWQRSGASRGKAALVICTDQALYAPGHPGEPTQGAAAVAMILDQEGFAEVGLYSYAFQRPAFDFWRPIGEPYPHVDGPLSVQCYKDAFASCLTQWKDDPDAFFSLDAVDAWAMHAPFPKMVQKGFVAGHAALGASEEEALAQFESHVLPTLAWNRRIGNCYTASTWVAFGHAAAHATGPQNIALFSYGSGCGAEILLIRQHQTLAKEIGAAVDAQFQAQRVIDAEQYAALRKDEGNSTS